MAIGPAQGGNIGVAPFAPLHKILAGGPIDRRMAKILAQIFVSHDPRMAAVAIGEAMELDQPMMKARRCNQGRVDLMT